MQIRKTLFDVRPHQDIVFTFNNIGSYLLSQRKYSEALKYHENALQIWKTLFGNTLPQDIASSSHNIGICLRSLGKLSKSFEIMKMDLNQGKRFLMILHIKTSPEVLITLETAFSLWGNIQKALNVRKIDCKYRRRFSLDVGPVGRIKSRNARLYRSSLLSGCTAM